MKILVAICLVIVVVHLGILSTLLHMILVGGGVG